MSGAQLSSTLKSEANIDSLYHDHHSWLKAWLRKRLSCTETASDLAQDTFLRILLKECPPRPDSPRAYLSTIARGLLMNHWRRQTIEQAYLDLLASQPKPFLPSVEEQQLVLETLQQLATVLEGVSERDRQVFLLARLDGLKYQQIAEHLGISLNMVQKAMVRTLHACYRVLYA